MRNVIVVCAGPACDAKLTGKCLRQSLSDQWSDHRNVVNVLASSQVIDRSDGKDGRDEMALVLDDGLKRAARHLERHTVWASVKAVSDAVLKAGGKLPGPEIVAIINATDAGALGAS